MSILLLLKLGEILWLYWFKINQRVEQFLLEKYGSYKKYQTYILHLLNTFFLKKIIQFFFLQEKWRITETSSSGGKKFTVVSFVTHVRISATEKFTCGTPVPETENCSRRPIWWPVQVRSLVASVCSRDHFGAYSVIKKMKVAYNEGPTICDKTLPSLIGELP